MQEIKKAKKYYFLLIILLVLIGLSFILRPTKGFEMPEEIKFYLQTGAVSIGLICLLIYMGKLTYEISQTQHNSKIGYSWIFGILIWLVVVFSHLGGVISVSSAIPETRFAFWGILFWYILIPLFGGVGFISLISELRGNVSTMNILVGITVATALSSWYIYFFHTSLQFCFIFIILSFGIGCILYYLLT